MNGQNVGEGMGGLEQGDDVFFFSNYHPILLWGRYRNKIEESLYG